ncbi:MAG: NAD/NADP octopine/nopaline dehydrogenase family protein [Christensenellaceae bacterium]|jgi:opine dehydrogenase|nr:NAD/NADP octopine/nopaline dehydrogenase family protein [Christensenellaceae bacterium]
MQIKRIAVLGAGNGGFMSAADMAGMNYDVTIYDTLPGKLEGVKTAGGIQVCDIDSNPVGPLCKVALAASTIEDALRGADVILNPVPFFAVKTYAEQAAPFIKDGQIIICLGKGGASLVWKKALSEAGNTSRVFLADCNTLPYGASRLNDTQVRLESRTLNLMFAAFPAKDMDIVWEVLQELYPAAHGYTLRRGQNVIDTLLVDYNAITHTPPMICNAAAIHSGDPDFHLFGVKENPKPVVNLIEAVDRERMAIGEKLGLKQYTLEEEIRMVKWNRDGVDAVLPIYEAIHTPFLEVCEGPFRLDVRHLVEDVPYGLVTYSSLGRLVGVPTPVCDAITTLAEGLLARDLHSAGRDIAALGLNPGWNIEQIKQFLYEGKIS